MRIRNQVTGTCAEVADGTELWDDWVEENTATRPTADSVESEHVEEPKAAPKKGKGA